MSDTYDVAVIGGGIVGAACAYYIAAEGLRTVLIERGCIGGGVTAAPMGHIAVMDDSEAQFALTAYSQRLWEEIYDELPPECELERCGAIWVAADQEEMEHVYSKHEFYGKRGVKTEVLDQSSLLAAEPNLRTDVEGGLLVNNDSVIFPMTAAKWLADSASGRGATKLKRDVKAIEAGVVEFDDGSSMRAGTIVNAAGPWARELSPELPIEWRKGHLAITDRYPGFARRQLIELGYLKSAHSHNTESVAFNVQPRATGQVLIGSSRQFVGEDDSVDRRILGKMLARAIDYMPGLAALNVIRCWNGFRPATTTHLPLIGQVKPGIYAAAGHEGLGVTTSLGTGKILADALVGRKPEIDVEPYLPGGSRHA